MAYQLSFKVWKIGMNPEEVSGWNLYMITLSAFFFGLYNFIF